MDRHIDQWNGMESLSLNPGHFSSILSTEVQVHTHWTKDKIVNQWSLGKLDICKQQSESRPISSDNNQLGMDYRSICKKL